MIPNQFEYQPQFQKRGTSTKATLLKINHSYLVLYSMVLRDFESNRQVYENLFINGERAKVYTGEMSKGSIVRLRNACELMIAVTPYKFYTAPDSGKRHRFKIGLITLTLSAKQGKVTDREIKKELLEPFIRKLRKYGLRNYVWKAERQRNGNIHFHIFVDCFIDKTDARNIWNRLQAKYHFITNFAERHGHNNPNSTDVKAVKSEKGLVQYMLKYMLKPVAKKDQLEINDDAKDYNTGKTWDCSLPLKTKNNTADFAEDDELDQLTELEKLEYLKVVVKDYCTLFFYNENENCSILPASLQNRYKRFLDHVQSLSSRL